MMEQKYPITAEKFPILFDVIREDGIPREKPRNALGGMWTPDVWDLNHYIVGKLTAWLEDEGSTRRIQFHKAGIEITENYRGEIIVK